jgi:hypothetical protein
MDHAHRRHTATGDDLEDVKVGHFVNVKDIGLEAPQGGLHAGAAVGSGQWEASLKGLAPSFFALAGAGAMKDRDVMAAITEGLCDRKNVGLGSSEGPESVVHK